MADNIEEEQLEALKDWWDRHGKSIFVVVLLSVGSVLGYQAWQKHVQEIGLAAALIYQDLVVASASITEETAGDAENNSEESQVMTTAKNLANTLKTDYTDSTYAIFAALHLAKLAVDTDDFDVALSELEWILEQGVNEEMEGIVRMRLARVLMEQGKTDEALATLDVTPDSSVQRASFAEVRGDIYSLVGAQQKAREAYQLAIDNLSEEVNSAMLKTKLAAIPIAVDPDADTDKHTANKDDADTPDEQDALPDPGDDV